MASGNSNLVQTEQIQKLINAVQAYSHEIAEAGKLLQQASSLCRTEMENDNLSIAYTNMLDNLLTEMASGVFPKLGSLVEGLSAEKKRVEELARVTQS